MCLLHSKILVPFNTHDVRHLAKCKLLMGKKNEETKLEIKKLK